VNHARTINFVWLSVESIIDWRIIRCGPDMEFTLLFLAIAVVMLAAWRGPRPLALALYAAVLIACVATYLHHATDTLKLSF
jgi:hypothetical protein